MSSSRFPEHAMIVEDLDHSVTYNQHQSMEGVVPNKVIIEGYPLNTKEYVLKLYLNRLTRVNGCTGMEVYGQVAVATFQDPIGMFALLLKYFLATLYT